MFKKVNNIHFVGIGGIGMSGIAELLMNLGFQITGSDINHSQNVKRLEKIGIKVIGLACKSDFDLIFALNLYKIIRREKPDIIHCHSRKGADFLSGFIAKSMSVSNSTLIVLLPFSDFESIFLIPSVPPTTSSITCVTS